MKRSAITRHTPLERGGKLPQRRAGPKRRTRHVMDMPRREGEQEPPQDASYLGEPVAFGPQAELCRSLRCIACWALELRRQGMTAATFDWLLLPKAYQTDDYRLRVEAHHEPPRGTKGGLDAWCIGLCHWHHQAGPFSRHRVGAARFYRHFDIDWRAVRAAMNHLCATRCAGE